METEPHGTSAELLARYVGGDEDAAEEIFRRYVDRLTQSTLSERGRAALPCAAMAISGDQKERRVVVRRAS